MRHLYRGFRANGPSHHVLYCNASLLLLIVRLVGASPAPANEIVIHVAPAGDDAWTGRLDAPNTDRTDGPVASLERARDLLRVRRAAPDGAGLPARVLLADGCYRLTRPFVLGPDDGGTAAAPVSYEAAPSARPEARPVISGGRPISGLREGTGADTGLWVADIPAAALATPPADRWRFEQLFVNGVRAVRAREPDAGVAAIEACIEEPLTQADTSAAAASGAKPNPNKPSPNMPKSKQRLAAARQTVTLAPDGFGPLAGLDPAAVAAVELTMHHKWDITRRFIERLDPERRQVVVSGLGMKPWNRWDAKSTAVFANARAFLDEPGEWFLDAAGRLVYKPRPGETLATAEVIAPVAPQLLVIQGDLANGRPCEHLTFSGIAFHHTQWLTPPAGFDPVQAAEPVTAAVMVDGARQLVIRDCTLAHTGGYGLWLRKGCRDCRVERCLVEDLAAGGVRIGTAAIAKADADHTAGNTIDHCTIRHGGRIFPTAVGIWIGQSSDNAITHNEIFDMFYTGISAGWTWGYGESRGQRNRIEANHIHRIGQGLLCDMGGIYTLGDAAGTVVRGNVIHDVAGRNYGGWGLYADEGTTGIVYEHNLVYDTTSGGFHQHYGRDNVVRHNVFVNARDWQVQVSRPEDHHSFTFERNVIAWRTGQSIKGPWDKLRAVTGSNCWCNTAGEPVTFLGKTLAEWQTAGHEQGSIVADPGFVAADRHDYRLKPDSPARALGFVPHDWSTAGSGGIRSAP